MFFDINKKIKIFEKQAQIVIQRNVYNKQSRQIPLNVKITILLKRCNFNKKHLTLL